MKSKHTEEQDNRIKGHGQYTEIVEQEFLPLVTKSKYCVVHFYHNDFERCKIINMHLRNIAMKHTEAKFAYLNAEKCPFFIQKLNIQMLPTVIMFNDGVAVDRICGFDDLGGVDDFPELILTRRLIFGGVLAPLNDKEEGRSKITKKKAVYNEVEDDY
uniref:Thioredoxin domain-containing protein n=1 Tax=Strombidinopsis acuminata TaxID=141414 RepID=A0A7S3X632_9SPIT|mmetsp:Transcript_78681/g.108992  ORF Transcript_78681/g.108992 Transcript_78681/m.108992 type:complete len:158 (+) Transcript_78681:275-748(+)